MKRGIRGYFTQQRWIGAGLGLALLAGQGVYSAGGPLHRFQAPEGDTSGLAWSPDGKLLASGNWLGGVTLWNVATGCREQVLRNALGGLVYAVAWSPDGRWLAVAGDNGGNKGSPIRVYSPASRKLVRSLHGHTYTVRSLAWSPDSTGLASVGMSFGPQPSFRVWDLSDLRRSQAGGDWD